MGSLANGTSKQHKTGRIKARLARFFGAFSIVIFIFDVAAICLFWFWGAPSDIGELYSRDTVSLNVERYAYRFSYAWPYPPIIYDFSEDEGAGSEAKLSNMYSWLRMNYLAQVPDRVFDATSVAIGKPTVMHVSDTSTLRPDLMSELQGSPHDAPQVVRVLSKRIVKLDTGWVAEIYIPSKSLNFYSPRKSGSQDENPMSDGVRVKLAPLLISGAKADIAKPLTGFLASYEYPLAIAKGRGGLILIACSHGSLLKFDEDGTFIKKVQIAGESTDALRKTSETGENGSDSGSYWVPVGGVLLGDRLVGSDTVLEVRRIMVIVLFGSVLSAYLAYAWANDRAKLEQKTH